MSPLPDGDGCLVQGAAPSCVRETLHLRASPPEAVANRKGFRWNPLFKADNAPRENRVVLPRPMTS